MQKIIKQKLYDTDTAYLLADDEYSNSRGNCLNTGRASYLYKTKKGAFFSFSRTIWQGEHDSICPLTPEEAKDLYEQLRNYSMAWEEAFGEVPEEA